jgi:hypothetical protein
MQPERRISFSASRRWVADRGSGANPSRFTELAAPTARGAEAERVVLKVPEVSDRIAVGEGAVWLAGWQGDMGPGGGTAPRGKVVRVDLEELERHQGDAAFVEVGTNHLEVGPK